MGMVECEVRLKGIGSGRESAVTALASSGIKVTAVEVKHVDLPQEMQRAMARQAEAEREKRAKVIHAEGELQASRTLAEAAAEVSKNPVAIQLRYLQTLSDIATERNSTIVFPLPVELLNAVTRRLGLGQEAEPLVEAVADLTEVVTEATVAESAPGEPETTEAPATGTAETSES